MGLAWSTGCAPLDLVEQWEAPYLDLLGWCPNEAQFDRLLTYALFSYTWLSCMLEFLAASFFCFVFDCISSTV
jgi:hypothetical protein